MESGMLWFDNDPKVGVELKIKQAATYYRKKYGKAPNLCLVNPALGADINLNGQAIKVMTDPIIMPNHFWIGVGTL